MSQGEGVQALHQEAVGQIPCGVGCQRVAAPALPDQHGRPLLPGPLAGPAHEGLHPDLREHAAAGSQHHHPPELRLLQAQGQNHESLLYCSGCWHAFLCWYSRVSKESDSEDESLDSSSQEDQALPEHKLLVYTGQIDSYYSALGMPKLEYRSLRFEEEFVPEPEEGFFQEASPTSGGFLGRWPIFMFGVFPFCVCFLEASYSLTRSSLSFVAPKSQLFSGHSTADARPR